ncbi:hypothetical protein ACFRAO_09925 [Streptomyces sp. NPDC056656]
MRHERVHAALAKKLGAWPAVFTAAGGVAAASWALADRHTA